MTNRNRPSRRTYTVSIRWADGTSTSGEFKTIAGAQGRVAWAREQANVVRVVTSF